jgi:hypothetical protein
MEKILRRSAESPVQGLAFCLQARRLRVGLRLGQPPDFGRFGLQHTGRFAALGAHRLQHALSGSVALVRRDLEHVGGKSVVAFHPAPVGVDPAQVVARQRIAGHGRLAVGRDGSVDVALDAFAMLQRAGLLAPGGHPLRVRLR